eukprot:CAMPEP_0204427958 /NCGR_PEP_ID=MMETSP0470-20130426/56533_1 /ASSEMBLY_ACC=CAM_ASM_000385 /TAXON_ID=2969 /ORGANISM="Oxyrrhis marina" /LENGTH=164 /DNA_ID=CAMNT_0051425815 /DNA_START=61 /DNA_END=557 /DNA_ORIENTATION=-
MIYGAPDPENGQRGSEKLGPKPLPPDASVYSKASDPTVVGSVPFNGDNPNNLPPILATSIPFPEKTNPNAVSDGKEFVVLRPRFSLFAFSSANASLYNSITAAWSFGRREDAFAWAISGSPGNPDESGFPRAEELSRKRLRDAELSRYGAFGASRISPYGAREE